MHRQTTRRKTMTPMTTAALTNRTRPIMFHQVQPSATRTSASRYAVVTIDPWHNTSIPLDSLLDRGRNPLVSSVDSNKPNNGLDDMFEPFKIENLPEPGAKGARGLGGSGSGLPPRNQPCPSCGSLNPPFNRHCEACGARLSQTPLPVAPQPMLRTTAGARALMVLAAVILTVALLALAVNVFRGDGGAAVTTVAPTTTVEPVLDIVELTPIQIRCDSEYPSFPCTALIDGDPEGSAPYNSWNAEDGGIGVEITVFFSPPVQLTEMIIYNVDDEERFHRNARAEGLEIRLSDLPQAIIEDLENTNEPQRIQLRGIRTSNLTITITGAYVGETWDGNAPYPELAMQEIQFYGRVSPDPGG